MTNAQEKIAQRKTLQDLADMGLAVKGFNPIPVATELMGVYARQDRIEALLSTLESAFADAATEAANTVMGRDAQAARDEHRAPDPYPAFVWSPMPDAPIEDRLAHLILGQHQLEFAVILGPPAPPPPVAAPSPSSPPDSIRPLVAPASPNKA